MTGRPSLLDERPEALEGGIVVLDVAPDLRPVDGGVAEAQADEVVVGGPSHLGQRAVDVTRRDGGERSGATAGPSGRATVEVVRPAIPRAAHRIREHGIGGRPAQQPLVGEDQLDVDPVGGLIAEALVDGAARGVAQRVFGLDALGEVLALAARPEASTASGGLIIIGRLPSVTEY